MSTETKKPEPSTRDGIIGLIAIIAIIWGVTSCYQDGWLRSEEEQATFVAKKAEKEAKKEAKRVAKEKTNAKLKNLESKYPCVNSFHRSELWQMPRLTSSPYGTEDHFIVSKQEFMNYPVYAAIKKRLREPESYDHVVTQLRMYHGGDYRVAVMFKGRNGFGGMSTDGAIIRMNPKNCRIKFIEFPSN